MARPLRVEREDRFAISAAELWELLGNTEHVNRLIGLPKVTFGPAQETAEGMFRPASTRMLGIRLKWREYAFDWVRDRRHSVLRVYESGPLERIHLGVELTPDDGGCRVRQFAEIAPRRGWPLARLVARVVTRRNMDALERFCREHERLHRERAVGAEGAPGTEGARPDLPRKGTARVERRLLTALCARLRRDLPVDAAALARLAGLIAQGSDEEVLRMRPFALARRWGLSREAVLGTFLYATTVGLLELDWELMCPNCRVPKAGFRTFGTVTEQFHCDLCGVDYAADLDRTTELRFSVHPSVRKAEDAIHCIGGPHNGRHILVQQGLRRGESETVLATLPAEPLRVRVLRLNRTVELRPDPHGPEVLALGFDGERWGASSLGFRPGPVRLEWHNRGDRTHVAVLEREEWDPDAATAARVMALPEFRSLFSAEVLQPGRQIGIRNLCVLFTDLKDSTALYERVGDAPAYGRVHRHFDFLVECCRHHEGGVVKTIGDAVMASFPSPQAALRAALEMQQGIGAFNAALGLAEPIVVKVGLHHGPAIAVNANGQMDYFGRTVNLAARIQGLSAGGDVVLAEALLAEPALQAVLGEVPCKVERFSAPLKGIAGEAALCRLRLEAGAPPAGGTSGGAVTVTTPRAVPRPRLFRY
jgi:class 3 adenylate cyclase